MLLTIVLVSVVRTTVIINHLRIYSYIDFKHFKYTNYFMYAVVGKPRNKVRMQSMFVYIHFPNHNNMFGKQIVRKPIINRDTITSVYQSPSNSFGNKAVHV